MARGFMGKLKRKFARRRKAARRVVRRVPRAVAARTHRVKRLGQLVYIRNSPTTGAPTLVADGNASFAQGNLATGTLPGTWDFTLSSQFMLQCLTQVSDMTNFFDRYKIVGVALKFHYLSNTALVQEVGTVQQYSNLPCLYYAFDGDDSLINTHAQITQKGYCKSRVLNANRPTSLYIRPRVAKTLPALPSQVGYSTEKPCWIDCNTTGVPHFGMKFSITDWVGGAGINNCLRIQPVYYLQFRDTI